MLTKSYAAAATGTTTTSNAEMTTHEGSMERMDSSPRVHFLASVATPKPHSPSRHRRQSSLGNHALQQKLARARAGSVVSSPSSSSSTGDQTDQDDEDQVSATNSPLQSPPITMPNPFHTPKTQKEEECVYVLTLSTTPSISEPLTQLREMYFPARLNKLKAHVTLFHALPHSQYPILDEALRNIAQHTRPYTISTGRPSRTRRGIAVLLEKGNEQTHSIRQELLHTWSYIEREAVKDGGNSWLSEQDSRNRGWQPHWTVMNKVDDEKKVDEAFGELRRKLCDEPEHGRATGLCLWKYLEGGEWMFREEFRFVAGLNSEKTTSAEGNGMEGEADGYFGVKERREGGGGLRSPEIVRKAGSKVKDVFKVLKERKEEK